MYRQGDILIIPIETLPSGESKELKDKVIARGETTGHKHLLRGAQLLMIANAMYVVAKKAAMVTHEEHGQIDLPAGNYLVRRQQEYTPAGWRQVHD